MNIQQFIEDIQRLQNLDKDFAQIQARARRIALLYLANEVKHGQKYTDVCLDKLEELLVEKLQRMTANKIP